MRNYSFKEQLGVLLLDLPRLTPALLVSKQWICAWNRKEALKVEQGGVDTTALGRWSTDLHACHVFPRLGGKLMQQAIKQWPFSFADKKSRRGKPEISFIIPHRGADRLPLLHLTVQSILAQQNVVVECIVVEQSPVQQVKGLPADVRYIHLPHPEDPKGWYKSWAFNVGVQAAEADIVVCHDGDILTPCGYTGEIMSFMRQKGYEVLHLHRFLFCLDRDATEYVRQRKALPPDVVPERVRQNWQGGTLAIRKTSFWDIGGYDECFVGWGGEDNEFYDRCMTLTGWRYGYLPFIHLWHEPQKTKYSESREQNILLLQKKLLTPVGDRIDRLRQNPTTTS